MIAALLLAFAPMIGGDGKAAAIAQVGSTPTPAQAGDALLQALLRRDPRQLPRSEPGAWKDFDPARLSPDTMPVEMKAVTSAILAGDMPAALASLYMLLDRVHEFPPALHMLGVVYFRLQRYGDSAVVLARYVELVPQRIGDTRLLGHDLYSLGRYAEARAHYEKVVALAPTDAEAFRGLALSHWRLGGASKALELLERVIELDPKNDEAWTWKAQVLFDEGRDEDALAAAEHARDLDAHAARVWFVLGQVLGDLGRTDEAQAAASRFKELDLAAQETRALENQLLYAPRDSGLLQRLLAVNERTGDLVRVRETIAHLVASKPDDVALRVIALDTLDRLGDVAGARTAARELEARAGERLAVWQRLSSFYVKTGDARGTARALENVSKLSAR